jgi:hypothetical protein
VTALAVILAVPLVLLTLPHLGFGLVVAAAYRELRHGKTASGRHLQRRTADLVDAYRLAHRARRGNW